MAMKPLHVGLLGFGTVGILRLLHTARADAMLGQIPALISVDSRTNFFDASWWAAGVSIPVRFLERELS